ARLAPRATFRPAELTAAGLTLTPEQSREFRQSGGRLPASLTLTRPQEEALIRAQLTAARRWDPATALLAAELTARANGIHLTLVHENGTVDTFGTAAARGEDTVTVYERGDEYLAAVPVARLHPASPLTRGTGRLQPPAQAAAPEQQSDATRTAGTARAVGTAQTAGAASAVGAGPTAEAVGAADSKGKSKQRATDEEQNPPATHVRFVDVPTAAADHEEAVAEAHNERAAAAAEVERLNALLRKAEQAWHAGSGPSGTGDARVAPQQRLDEAMARFEAAERRLSELGDDGGQSLGNPTSHPSAVLDLPGSADDPMRSLLAQAWHDLAAARGELAAAEGLLHEMTARPDGDSGDQTSPGSVPERVENGPASPHEDSPLERPRALSGSQVQESDGAHPTGDSAAPGLRQSMDITDLAPSRTAVVPVGSKDTAAPGGDMASPPRVPASGAASHPALNQPLNPNPPLHGFLYHGSSAPPESVFRQGLNSAARQEGADPHYDITQHIHNARGSGFVSTTANQNVALQFIRPSGDAMRVGKDTFMKREGFVYVVDPGDTPLIHLHSQNLPENLSRFRYQEEWAALDSIPPERIKGVIRVSGYYNPVPDGKGGITIEPAKGSSLAMPFTPNPGFEEPTPAALSDQEPGTGPADDRLRLARLQELGDLGLARPEPASTGADDGSTATPVHGEQIAADERAGVSSEQWRGLPSAAAFEDFGRAFEQSSLRRWNGLQDATVREVSTDPLVRSFEVSRPGLAGSLTITVTHKPADDAVAVTFSGDDVPPSTREWSGTGFRDIAADLRDNVLYDNDLFATVPTPASWQDPAPGPDHPELIPSTPAGPLTGPGRSALSTPAQSDAVATATLAGGRSAVDPSVAEETASSGPWTTGKVTFKGGSEEVGTLQRGYLAHLARKVVKAGLRDIRAGLQAPFITVTGYGNGSWLTPGSSDWGAESRGQGRADAVADVLRTEIWNALDLLQRDVPADRRVDSSAFTIVSDSGGRGVAADGVSGAADVGDLRRRATIEIDLAPRSQAVELLDNLRLAGTDPALREAPFDPEPFARKILHLGEQQPVRDHHRHQLYALVDEAVAAGRATSPAALGAYHLWRQGALSDATRITAPDGRALGRNWTGAQVTDLAAKSYFLVREGSVVDSPAALWQQAGTGDTRPYVVAAKGGHDHVVVALTDGSRPRVPLDEFAELLAMDSDLAGLDGGLPVVLAVPHAGARSPRLPRTAAARTGRTVWAHSGEAELYHDPRSQRTRIVVADRRAAGEPLGSWFASGPDHLSLDGSAAGVEERFLRAIDGTLVPDDDIMSHTLAADGRPYGRAVLGKDDIVRREGYFDSLPAMDEYVHIDPVSGNFHGGAESVPWSGREAYFFNLHGHPGEFEIRRTDGTLKAARGDQVGGYLRRSPSFRRLPADGVVVLLSCWVGAAADGPASVNTAGRAPFVADPLATLSEAQQVANHTDRTVFAVDRVHYLTQDQGTKRQGIATTAEGERRQWLELRPEPRGAALDDLARTAGLHADAGPAPEGTRESTLRLVRALRQVFGAAVEDDRDDAHGEYQRLLRGIGALESMRRNDPGLRDTGPFTMDLLERAARSHLGRPAGSVLDSADVLAVLEAAETRPDGTVLRDFVPLASVDKALGLLARSHADQRAVEVLDLDAGSVTAVDRQRLLWATVKAVEGLESADVDALAVGVLHLDASAHPVDDARREELLWTVAGAAAAGRDVHNPTALGAYHLQRNGALAKETLLHSGSGRVTGRNWTGRPMTGSLFRDRYIAVDPAVGRTSAAVRPVPWHGSGTGAGKKPPGFLLLVEGGPDHIDMPWPDGSRRPVPVVEIAELLTHDDKLSGRPHTEPIVPVMRRSGSSGPLMTALSDRAATGRPVFMPAGHVDLYHDTATNEDYLVVDEPAGVAGSSTGWAHTEPPALVPPVPASAPVTVSNAAPATEARVTSSAPSVPYIESTSAVDAAGSPDAAAMDATAASAPWTSARITFEEGSKEITPAQRGDLAALARKVAEAGLRDLRDGFAAPWITVTGHGNGSWLKPASGDRGAERTGQERADAVADVLRTEIADSLNQLQRKDPPTADRVDADVFRIDSRSGGRSVAAVSPSDGADLRTLRRQADIGIDLAPRSPAIELLNSLRLAEPEFGLAEGAFDPDPFARRLLHLKPEEPIREAHRRALYDLVDEANAAGRATSLAAVGAFDFWKRGALSDATLITGRDGRALGRNWTDTPAPDLITASYQLVKGTDVQTSTALWEQQGAGDNRPYVIAAKGGFASVVLRLADRSRPHATLEEFAELLSMDQDLAALDGRLPVVLAVPHAGARSPR
ncbi:lonely Cys domain-containing protein, partial [Streptomyces hyaluromycini]